MLGIVDVDMKGGQCSMAIILINAFMVRTRLNNTASVFTTCRGPVIGDQANVHATCVHPRRHREDTYQNTPTGPAAVTIKIMRGNG